LSEFLRSSGWTADVRIPRAFIMIDVDGFKAVNDGYGHPTGDAALASVAGVIRAHVREGDFCARYGGDEFVVVLPGCDRAAGETRGAELQHAVDALQLPSPEGTLRLGISVGVSAFPADGDTMPSLIAVADRRMYLDKAGRRRVLDEALYTRPASASSAP
jgi:diguanylate cyclase (GGDEF)-like protein